MFRFLLPVFLAAVMLTGCKRRPMEGSVVLQADPAQPGLNEVKAEVNRLSQTKPLTSPVRVWVVGSYVTGWHVPPGQRGHLIGIPSGTPEQMVKRIRHEWEHARQHDRGEHNELKACDAEGE